jgi:hypothetical protein
LLDVGIVDFSLLSTQDIRSRRAKIQLNAITSSEGEWELSKYSLNECHNPPLQYILEQDKDGQERLNVNQTLRLTKLNAFTLVFLDGSQAQIQVPKVLSDTLILSS